MGNVSRLKTSPTGIRLDPASPSVYASRAKLHARQRRFTDAERDYREAVRLDPRPLEPRLGLGTALFATGRPDEALAVLDEAVRQHPRDPHAYLRRGTVLAEVRRPDDALRDFATALSLNPEPSLRQELEEVQELVERAKRKLR